MHGKTVTVPPSHVFITSNQTLFNHEFDTVERSGKSFRKSYPATTFPRINPDEGDMKAVRAR